MRTLNSYDMIYCDIDNTLIHGRFVNFMDKCWHIFHSKLLANILMSIESFLCLYNINQTLYFMLLLTDTPITFLTARSPHRSTVELVCNLFKLANKDKKIKVVELGSSTPALDKMKYIAEHLNEYPNCCLFEDNKETIHTVASLDIDVFDASTLYEERIR